MPLMELKRIAPGLAWISIPSRGVFIQCGCPADSVKHLIKNGLIRNTDQNGLVHETGPNCLLLADLTIQNGQFSNLGEFPVLQMFYRQGIMIPNHPGFTADKPIMIGNQDQISSQLNYVFRGNYGLISEQEMQEAGLSSELAAEYMRIKLHFAFGKIKPPDELFDIRILENLTVEIKNGVFIKRVGTNRFVVTIEKESLEVDLNLTPNQSYLPTYNLGYHRFLPEFFSVVHTGEGDGWDVHRPSMASIVCFGPDVYLIDAGPHITHSLRALGLSLNSVRGLFQTHGHDDHFAGLTELMLGDHRIEYYTTPLVRHSVNKKLQALLNVDIPVIERFFITRDLQVGQWNNVDGLEVKPQYSPHPVETNTFMFRVATENGYKTYNHLADIASFSTLQKMVEKDPQKPGISEEYLQAIRTQYLTTVDLKKLDIGGGMVHGQASDFAGDRSTKIVLAHTSTDLKPSETSVGKREIFGQTDHLIGSVIDYRQELVNRTLHHYFPTVPTSGFFELLNQKIRTIDPGYPLCPDQIDQHDIFLVLKGIITDPADEAVEYVAGCLVGDDPNCSIDRLFAKSFVEVLRLPQKIFSSFLDRYDLKRSFSQNIHRRRILQNCELFQHVRWSPLLINIVKLMQEVNFSQSNLLDFFGEQSVFILEEGKIELSKANYQELIVPGSFCHDDNVIRDQIPLQLSINVLEASKGFLIPYSAIQGIPGIEWKLLESYKRRAMGLKKLKVLGSSAA